MRTILFALFIGAIVSIAAATTTKVDRTVGGAISGVEYGKTASELLIYGD